MKTKFTAAQIVGIGLLFVGIFFLILNISLIQSSGLVLRKFFIVGVAAIPSGLSMIVFKGGPIGPGDLSGRQGLSQIINASPKTHVAIWVLSLLGGIAAGFYVYTKIGGTF
jgi:hypothetical protein